jgi:hypothetical protein
VAGFCNGGPASWDRHLFFVVRLWRAEVTVKSGRFRKAGPVATKFNGDFKQRQRRPPKKKKQAAATKAKNRPLWGHPACVIVRRITI